MIDQRSGEGIFRIADNRRTPGLKIWTFGYPNSAAVDPRGSVSFDRPFIELWAGVTRKFGVKLPLAASERMGISESYAPSVGLDSVSHASQHVLVNLLTSETDALRIQMFSLWPERTLRLLAVNAGQMLFDTEIVADPTFGNQLDLPLDLAGIAANHAPTELLILDQKGAELLRFALPTAP
ncbi:MAG: hypothetical protein HC802_06560 [Caldilineaceae bacterium]|nr:hypothetical protein [Caldilineaceae bacterium]